jgi:carnitine O-acetyltransferase
MKIFYRFNSARFPTVPSDTAKKFAPEQHNHIVFVRNNRFYEVPVVIDGKEVSARDLEAMIDQVVASADKAGKGEAVGALTSENRDTWTKAREHLSSIGNNAKTLERIDSAIIIVPLDDTTPTSREELSWACWTGANGGSGAANRWYDKHQLIVFDNARSGFLGEHSCMVSALLFCIYNLAYKYLSLQCAGWNSNTANDRIHDGICCCWKDLNWRCY